MVKNLIVTTILIICINSVYAQNWQPLNGPISGPIKDIEVLGDSVYVVTSDPVGLFKRDIHSADWYHSPIIEGAGAFRKEIANTLSFKKLNSTGIYFVGGEGVNDLEGNIYSQFFLTRDFGKNWEEFRSGIESCGQIGEIILDPNSQSLIQCSGGIYLLDDELNSFTEFWREYSNPAESIHIFNDAILIGTRKGVRYSNDVGVSWVSIGIDSLEVLSITSTSKGIYFGTSAGLFLSANIESGWEEITEFSGKKISYLQNHNDSLIVGLDNEIYLLTDEVNKLFKSSFESNINAINSSIEGVYVGTDNELFTCSLVSDECIRNGVPSVNLRYISSINHNTLVITTSDSIFRYNNLHNEWDNVSIPVERAERIISKSQDSILTVSRSFFLECSFEYGSCDSTQVDFSNILFDLAQNINNDLFVASNEKVFESSDYGKTWQMIYENPQRTNRLLFTFSDSLLFINTENGLIKYNTKSDQYRTLGFEESGINSYYITSTGIIYVTVFYSVHKSLDLGDTWELVLREQDLDEWDILMDVTYDETREKLYVLEREGKIYVSNNEGIDWGVDIELTPKILRDIEINEDGTLFVGTESAGVYKTDTILEPQITISVEKESKHSLEFLLNQNYPNPFNPTTQINFVIPKGIFVKIEVFNLLGQRVGTLVKEYKNTGNYTVQFDASHLSNGIYFYTINAGEFTETKKMMLIK